VSGEMAYDSARGVTVMFDGIDTREWNGMTWTKRAVAVVPGFPSGRAMAYDAARAVTVLFDGADTWEWNGESWIRRAVAAAPSPRSGYVMAYDSRRHVTVLFGGLDETRGVFLLWDTWEWDGMTWSLRAEEGPWRRQWSAMTYDSTRKVTVLFGGMSNSMSQPT